MAVSWTAAEPHPAHTHEVDGRALAHEHDGGWQSHGHMATGVPRQAEPEMEAD